MDHLNTDFLKVVKEWPNGTTSDKKEIDNGKLFVSQDRSERVVTDVTYPFGESGWKRYFDYVIACIKEIVNFILCKDVEWPQMEVIAKRELQVRTESYHLCVHDGSEGLVSTDSYKELSSDVFARAFWLSGITDKSSIKKENEAFMGKLEKVARAAEGIIRTSFTIEYVSDKEGKPVEILLKATLNKFTYEKTLPVKASETDLASIKTAMIAGRRFPVRVVGEVSKAGDKERARNELIFQAAREVSGVRDGVTYRSYHQNFIDHTEIRVVVIGVQSKKETPSYQSKPGMVISRQDGGLVIAGVSK